MKARKKREKHKNDNIAIKNAEIQKKMAAKCDGWIKSDGCKTSEPIILGFISDVIFDSTYDNIANVKKDKYVM